MTPRALRDRRGHVFEAYGHSAYREELDLSVDVRESSASRFSRWPRRRDVVRWSDRRRWVGESSFTPLSRCAL